MESIMENVNDFHISSNTKTAITVLLDGLTKALDYPEATLTVAAAVPLLKVILEVSVKLEERMSMLSQRLAICEIALSSSGGLIPSKSASCEGLS
jgi:hypothetical protein